VKRIGDIQDDHPALGAALARWGRRACPTDEQLAAWLDGALAPLQAARVARHAGECASCGAIAAAHRGASVLPARRRRAAIAAAASLACAIVVLLVATRRGDPIGAARVALASGEQPRALALLDDHLGGLDADARARTWPRIVALLAGEELPHAGAPAAERFRAPDLARRAVRFPAGTIRSRRPMFVAAASGPAAEIIVERDRGPGADYAEVLRVDLPSGVARVPFPAAAEELEPGHYALTVRGERAIDSVHAFVVKDATPLLDVRLAEADAAGRDPVLRALARCRVLCEAGFEGDALAELDGIEAAAPAIAAWRAHLERRL
jgi:hypothetical protein